MGGTQRPHWQVQDWLWKTVGKRTPRTYTQASVGQTARLWSPAVVRLLNQQKPVEEPSRVTPIDHLDIRLLREGLGGPIRAKGHARSAITGRYISRAAAGRHPRTLVVEVGEAMAERLRRGLHDLD